MAHQLHRFAQHADRPLRARDADQGIKAAAPDATQGTSAGQFVERGEIGGVIDRMGDLRRDDGRAESNALRMSADQRQNRPGRAHDEIVRDVDFIEAEPLDGLRLGDVVAQWVGARHHHAEFDRHSNLRRSASCGVDAPSFALHRVNEGRRLRAKK